MSFWDTQEADENSLSSILEHDPVDMEALVTNPELFQNFRSRDEQLMTCLIKPENLQNLINVIFTNKNAKTAKLALELFNVKSPLIKHVINNSKLVELCFSYIKSPDYTKVGYAIRFFTNALTEVPDLTTAIFTKFPDWYQTLFKLCNSPGISDLIVSIASSQETEDNWFLWSGLTVCAGKDLGAPPAVWNNPLFNRLASGLAQIGLETSQKIGIIKIVKSYVSSMYPCPLTNRISEILPILFANKSLQLVTLELALSLPKNAAIILEAKKLAVSPLPSTPISVAALSVLTKFAHNECDDIFKALASKFIADTKNTFFMYEYVRFFTEACKDPSLAQKAADLFAPYILQKGRFADWRKSVPRIGFLLEIAEQIDIYSDNIDGWEDFRSNELKQWKERESGTPDDSVSMTTTSFAQKMAAFEGSNQELPLKTTVTETQKQNTPKVEEKKVEEPPKKAEEPKPEPVKAPEPVKPPVQEVKPVQQPFVPPPQPQPAKPNDVSVERFFELIKDPYWAYNGLPPEQVFQVKEAFETAEEAFDFLVKQQ